MLNTNIEITYPQNLPRSPSFLKNGCNFEMHKISL